VDRLARGQFRWAQAVDGKRRPIVNLTRDAVIDVRESVTVVEVTRSIRGLAVEVPLGDGVGLADPSVVNCDGIQTLRQSAIDELIAVLDQETLEKICTAAAIAIGCR
jgi:mRNA-degrading endonuclease toxin of MazEF toxin-antitoxin module